MSFCQCQSNNSFPEVNQILGKDQKGVISKIRFVSNKEKQSNLRPDINVDESSSLSAVVVSIRNGSSYDELFSKVEQKGKMGTHVNTYLVDFMDPGTLLNILRLSKDEINFREIEHRWGRDAIDMCKDIASVDPCSVVFNWECCSGFSAKGFSCDKIDQFRLVSYLLHECHYMLMFSDFSLKALLHEWDEAVLGVNPFVMIGSFNSQMKLCFDPCILKSCAFSSQLQVLGELCDSGEADVHAMGGTIAYAIDSSKVDASDGGSTVNGWKSLDVLTIVTEVDTKESAQILVGEKREFLSRIVNKVGIAGHCCLQYSGGGILLTSCPHWIELTKLNDVSIESILKVASNRYGDDEVNKIQMEIGALNTEGDRQEYCRKKSLKYVQQSAPGKYTKKKM